MRIFLSLVAFDAILVLTTVGLYFEQRPANPPSSPIRTTASAHRQHPASTDATTRVNPVTSIKSDDVPASESLLQFPPAPPAEEEVARAGSESDGLPPSPIL